MNLENWLQKLVTLKLPCCSKIFASTWIAKLHLLRKNWSQHQNAKCGEGPWQIGTAVITDQCLINGRLIVVFHNTNAARVVHLSNLDFDKIFIV